MKNSFHTLFRVPTSNTFIQLFRHFFSGGIAFTADISVLYVLTEYFGVYYLISSFFGFFIGLIITYVLSVKWIFDERRAQSRMVEISVFAVIGLIGLLLTSGFMWFFTSVLLLHYMYSKVITTGIVFFWNFLAKKMILFTKKK